MEAIILAGGEGRRLRDEGIGTPKAMVPLGGRPLLLRLRDTLAGLGFESITALVRRSVLDPAEQGRLAAIPGFRIVTCETPSSLHTLAEGLRAIGPGPAFCAMVDSVMREDDWRRVVASSARQLDDGADASVAVTPFLDDERPLYVWQRADGSVERFADRPGAPVLVTGGVYVLSSRVRSLVPRVLGLGMTRMRGFLAWLVEHGYRVETAEIPRIVDLDRGRDLAQAEAWIGVSP
jgi:NDP-sugar pyrophosphorylase family protein